MELLFIIAVTFCTLGSQLLIKQGVSKLNIGMIDGQKIDFLFQAVTSPYIIAAIAIQGTGFLMWILVVSRMKLGVAFAISGSFFYILVALSSWWLYGEKLSAMQWFGLAFVSLGVVLLNIGDKV